VRIGLEGAFGYRYMAALNWIASSGYSEDNSFDIRADLLSRGIGAFLDAPLFGHGLWGFGRASGLGTYAHNTFVEVAVDFGLLGSALYWIGYLYLLRRGLRGTTNTSRSVTLGAIFALMVIDFANVTIGKPFF